jgi:hypothetical protein
LISSTCLNEADLDTSNAAGNYTDTGPHLSGSDNSHLLDR